MVIEDNYRNGNIVSYCSCKFVKAHAEASVSCDKNASLACSHIASDCSAKTESHGSKTAGSDPCALVSELEKLGCPALMLANVSNDPCIGFYDVGHDVDRITRKERKTFVSICLSLLELFNLLDPFCIFTLGNSVRKLLYEIFYVTADTEINRNILADFSAVAVNVDLCSGERKLLRFYRESLNLPGCP